MSDVMYKVLGEDDEVLHGNVDICFSSCARLEQLVKARSKYIHYKYHLDQLLSEKETNKFLSIFLDGSGMRQFLDERTDDVYNNGIYVPTNMTYTSILFLLSIARYPEENPKLVKEFLKLYDKETTSTREETAKLFKECHVNYPVEYNGVHTIYNGYSNTNKCRYDWVNIIKEIESSNEKKFNDKNAPRVLLSRICATTEEGRKWV